MRPETAKQQQNEQIWIENDPDPSENRVHAGLFAFASFSIGNCSDIP
jgi:hypothetical protein